MTTKVMKLGMLGMWHPHAEGIVRRVSEHPAEFSLLGFYDPDPAVAARRRERWAPLLGGLRLFERPEQLLEQELDGVVVEGRVFENLALARLAVESGRPVLLEKPAGDKLEEHRRLIELARRKNVHVQMAYLFRYMSAVRELVARVRRGELGRVYEFRGRLPKPLHEYPQYVDELGSYRGGIFFEMAGHLVDLLVALLGPPQTVTPFLGHHHDAPGSFVDHGVAVLGFERAWGIIEVPALEVAPRTRRIEVYGTLGAAVIPHLGSGHLANEPTQPLEVYQGGQAEWQRFELPAKTLQIDDLREFAAVVAGRKPPDFDFQHDLAVQRALLAASGML